MSAFWATCPKCGARYFHLFVGSQMLSGHVCSEPTCDDCQHDGHSCAAFGCAKKIPA